MHGSRWRREETRTSRASTAARSGRLSPTLPRREPSEVSAFIDQKREDSGVCACLRHSWGVGVGLLPAQDGQAEQAGGGG